MELRRRVGDECEDGTRGWRVETGPGQPFYSRLGGESRRFLLYPILDNTGEFCKLHEETVTRQGYRSVWIVLQLCIIHELFINNLLAYVIRLLGCQSFDVKRNHPTTKGIRPLREPTGHPLAVKGVTHPPWVSLYIPVYIVTSVSKTQTSRSGIYQFMVP